MSDLQRYLEGIESRLSAKLASNTQTLTSALSASFGDGAARGTAPL